MQIVLKNVWLTNNNLRAQILLCRMCMFRRNFCVGRGFVEIFSIRETTEECVVYCFCRPALWVEANDIPVQTHCAIGGGRWFRVGGRRKSHERDSCSNGPLQEVYVWKYSTKLQVLWRSAALFTCISYITSCCSLNADWGECMSLSREFAREARGKFYKLP